MPKVLETLKLAALALDGHGFAESFGDMSEPGGWNGLTTVSPVLLDNVGEHDLANDLRALAAWHVDSSASFVVWVRMDENGHSVIYDYALCDTQTERDLLTGWDYASDT